MIKSDYVAVSSKPRLLFISPISPLSPFSGFSYRAFGLLKWLVKRYCIDLIFEGNNDDIKKSFISTEQFNAIRVIPPSRYLYRKLMGVFGKLPYHHVLYSHPLMKRAVDELIRANNYDLIWINKSVHHPIIADKVSIPFIIDQIAAEPIVWDNLIQNDPRRYLRLFFKWNKYRVLRYDKKAYEKAAGIVCISKLDYQITKKYHPKSNLICLPQGVDPSYYKPASGVTPDPNVLLFSGTGARRNIEAIEMFSKKIFPLLRRHNPKFKLLWIGNLDYNEYRKFNLPWMVSTGLVKHTPPYFDLGMIYVAPFTMGEGMKTKIVEAMAMGKVIVATPIGVQGIEVDGLPFVKVCSKPSEFADAILSFKNNPDLLHLGELARNYALKNYTWDVVLEPLEIFLNNCMKNIR